MHICMSKLIIIVSVNGLSPGRRQTIIWINAGMLSIGPSETNFSEIFIKIHTFSLKKMYLKTFSTKRRPFCLSFNVLINCRPVLMSKKHLEDETKNEPKKEEPSTKTEPMETDNECEFIVQPMRWGLIPSWHKGEMKNVGYNMINTRSEGMLSKATFSRPLLKGRRCVILVEGWVVMILMALYTAVVSLMHLHWRYHSLPLSHQCLYVNNKME